MVYYSFFTFLCFHTIYIWAGISAWDYNMNNQPYKRQYRQLDDETKQKISASSRNKPKSFITKERIRQSMLKYWETVPNKEDTQWYNVDNDHNDEDQD